MPHYYEVKFNKDVELYLPKKKDFSFHDSSFLNCPRYKFEYYLENFLVNKKI